MMTENELNAIRERLDEATPGPWDVFPAYAGMIPVSGWSKL